jgi:uncharacterized protein involved in exopolysaccharide biosynthesis
VDEISFRQIVETVARRWKLVVLCVALATAITGIASALRPKMYTAEATLIFPPTLPGGSVTQTLLSLAGVSGPMSGFNAPLSAENVSAILESRTVMDKIITDFGLVARYDARNAQAARKTLRKRTKLRSHADGTLSIEATDRDPQIAAEMANRYITHLDEYAAQKLNIHRQKQRKERLKEAARQVQRELDAADKALRDFSEEHQTIQPTDQVKALISSLSSLESQLVVTKAQLSELEVASSETQDYLRRVIEAPPGTLPEQSPYLSDLRKKLQGFEYDLAVARQDRTEQDPQVRRLTTEIAETERQIGQEVSKIAESIGRGLEPDLVDAETKRIGKLAAVGALKKAIGELEAEQEAMPDLMRRYTDLSRQQSVCEQAYVALQAQEKAAEIGEFGEDKAYEVLDPATPPTVQSSPRVKLNMAVAFVCSGLVSAFFALFIEGAGQPGAPRTR